MPARVFLLDKNGNPVGIDEVLRQDDMSKALVAITLPHARAHEGLSFFTDFVDEDMGDDATLIIAFRTMSAPLRVHMTGEFSTLIGGDIAVWEDPTWNTNTGTANPIVNRRREVTPKSSGLLEDKTVTPLFTATDNVLVNVVGLNTTGATRLHHFYAFGAQGRTARGGARDSEEIILKPDTQYALVFTADGANNKAQIILNWYESIDSEEA